MKYWGSLRRERARTGVVTLNMVAEFVENIGFEIVRQPNVNAAIGAVATTESTYLLDVEADYPLCVLLLTAYRGVGEFNFDKRACSYLVILEEGAELPANPSSEERRTLARSIVVKAHEKGMAVNELENGVGNFIISVERFTTCLAQNINSTNQYQALVDVAEEFFGNFISIVDPNNMLLAYTKHIEPTDPVSKSLIRHRYHTEEFVEPHSENGFVSPSILTQEGVRVVRPSSDDSIALLTSSITVNGNYAGYVVMTCDYDEVRAGTKDAFSMFVSHCEKMAALRSDLPAGRNPHSQNLLITLLSRKAVDTIFIEQQARRLAIPTVGSYKLIRITWPDDCVAQLPFFVDEINRGNPSNRVAVRFENTAVILVYADNVSDLNLIAGQIINSFPASIAYQILTSEVLSTLFEIYYAYRTLKCVEKYESAILRYKSFNSEEEPIILTFRDAFAFYWDDPLRDTTVSNFAVSHMVINDIARVDAEKRTDDLALLEAFLVNERKASTVAETHHLHRNGVLYRIKRIQERYGIDLNDHLTRQYILACLRVRASVHGTILAER